MSYGIDLSGVGHRVADMVDQILKGAKPGEIPIFQPTQFELSINLKTAKTLGIELPPLLVAASWAPGLPDFRQRGGCFSPREPIGS